MEVLNKDTEAIGSYRFWSLEQRLFMSPDLYSGFHLSPDSDWVMLQQFLQLWCDLTPKPQPIQGTGVEVLNKDTEAMGSISIFSLRVENVWCHKNLNAVPFWHGSGAKNPDRIDSPRPIRFARIHANLERSVCCCSSRKEHAMKRLVVSSAVALLAIAGAAIAADLKSGLNVGESVGTFSVTDCTGPNQGKTLCYR